MKPILAARKRASSPSDILSMRCPATWISPASGRSMPPSRLSSVVLPEPDGPITATKSPRGMPRSRRSKIAIASWPLVKPLHRPARRTIVSGANVFLLLMNRGLSWPVPAIPLSEARPRHGKRDHRDEPGDDDASRLCVSTASVTFSVRGGGFFRPRAGRRVVLEERDLHGHVGQDARVLALQSDAHPHGRLLAVGGRHDGDDGRRYGPVRIGIEHGVDAHAGGHAADESLVDVDFDLDRIHVHHRAHAG